MKRRLRSHFALSLARKDVELAMDMAAEAGLELRQTEGTLAELRGAEARGFGDWAVELLEGEGFAVTSYDTLAPLAEPERLADVDLIVPIWSSARSCHQEEFGNMNAAEERGMLELIANGCGIAGWHGHMGDAFRDHPSYHFLIGGQFVAHPPGWPDNLQPEDDYVDYDVTITKPDDPIVQGIPSFRLKSEQYYMLVDASNDVLATTTFSGEHMWWIEGTRIPVVWKRRWDKGRVFYCSLGHEIDDLRLPQVTEIMRRGMNWAAGGGKLTRSPA